LHAVFVIIESIILVAYNGTLRSLQTCSIKKLIYVLPLIVPVSFTCSDFWRPFEQWCRSAILWAYSHHHHSLWCLL